MSLGICVSSERQSLLERQLLMISVEQTSAFGQKWPSVDEQLYSQVSKSFEVQTATTTTERNVTRIWYGTSEILGLKHFMVCCYRKPINDRVVWCAPTWSGFTIAILKMIVFPKQHVVQFFIRHTITQWLGMSQKQACSCFTNIIAAINIHYLNNLLFFSIKLKIKTAELKEKSEATNTVLCQKWKL